MAEKTDTELLAQIAEERRNSSGFDEDAVLTKERERSLEYYKGEMRDVPAIEGRSRAVSSDIRDAIETILPDLVEIFTSEDVASFQPRGEEDEDAAEQETDYINHVFFNENNGFMILYTIMKDALQVKTGITKCDVEEYDESEDFEGKSLEEAIAADEAYGDALTNARRDGDTFSYRIERKGKRPCVRAVAPEDFTVSRDTVALKETPYCAHRARWRVYDLIEAGYDRAKVETLTTYGYAANSEEERARDTVGESDMAAVGIGDRRIVEVVEHYLREGGKYTRVLTGNNEQVLLKKETVKRHGFSAITPYIVTHRFYGESVSDLLMENQRIRTALTRMVLDQGYFALNGRNYIDMTKVNEWTISDLLNNAPNMPVRGEGPQAVTPLQSSPLPFDGFGALEYFATQGENRTGIVRNAQGLNPDTLHDTATGALALMSASQKRVRLIARIFAETGIKDMLLELHALIRETASGPLKARLRNKWVDMDPTSWGSRSDMTIEIGVGASGREAMAVQLQQGLEVMERIAAGQGGPVGPVVTWQNIYAMTKRFLEKGLGFKSAEMYLTDPAPKEGEVPPPPEPDPAMLEMQAKQEMAQAELQMKGEYDAAKLQMEAERDAAKDARDRESAMLDAELKREVSAENIRLAREKAAADIELSREKTAAEISLKERLLAAELDLKERTLAAELALKERGMAIDAELSVATSGVEIGGDAG